MSPFIRAARSLKLEGSGVLLIYIAGIVTAIFILAIYEAIKAVGG